MIFRCDQHLYSWPCRIVGQLLFLKSMNIKANEVGPLCPLGSLGSLGVFGGP